MLEYLEISGFRTWSVPQHIAHLIIEKVRAKITIPYVR